MATAGTRGLGMSAATTTPAATAGTGAGVGVITSGLRLAAAVPRRAMDTRHPVAGGIHHPAARNMGAAGGEAGTVAVGTAAAELHRFPAARVDAAAVAARINQPRPE